MTDATDDKDAKARAQFIEGVGLSFITPGDPDFDIDDYTVFSKAWSMSKEAATEAMREQANELKMDYDDFIKEASLTWSNSKRPLKQINEYRCKNREGEFLPFFWVKYARANPDGDINLVPDSLDIETLVSLCKQFGCIWHKEDGCGVVDLVCCI